MDSGERIKINQSGIVHETIDGEVVIVNLETGTYYSLQSTGAAVWNVLVSSPTESELCAAVVARYDVDPDSLTAELHDFLDELQREALVLRDAGGSDPSRAEPFDEPTDKMHFETLRIQKFTDMTEALLLDPVHDVDREAGWPVKQVDEVPPSAYSVGGK